MGQQCLAPLCKGPWTSQGIENSSWLMNFRGIPLALITFLNKLLGGLLHARLLVVLCWSFVWQGPTSHMTTTNPLTKFFRQRFNYLRVNTQQVWSWIWALIQLLLFIKLVPRHFFKSFLYLISILEQSSILKEWDYRIHPTRAYSCKVQPYWCWFVISRGKKVFHQYNHRKSFSSRGGQSCQGINMRILTPRNLLQVKGVKTVQQKLYLI